MDTGERSCIVLFSGNGVIVRRNNVEIFCSPDRVPCDAKRTRKKKSKNHKNHHKTHQNQIKQQQQNNIMSNNNKSSSSSTALSQWELENNITESDQIYKYDPEKQNAILSSRPWSQEYVFHCSYTFFFIIQKKYHVFHSHTLFFSNKIPKIAHTTLKR